MVDAANRAPDAGPVALPRWAKEIVDAAASSRGYRVSCVRGEFSVSVYPAQARRGPQPPRQGIVPPRREPRQEEVHEARAPNARQLRSAERAKRRREAQRRTSIRNRVLATLAEFERRHREQRRQELREQVVQWMARNPPPPAAPVAPASPPPPAPPSAPAPVDVTQLGNPLIAAARDATDAEDLQDDRGFKRPAGSPTLPPSEAAAPQPTTSSSDANPPSPEPAPVPKARRSLQSPLDAAAPAVSTLPTVESTVMAIPTDSPAIAPEVHAPALPQAGTAPPPQPPLPPRSPPSAAASPAATPSRHTSARPDRSRTTARQPAQASLAAALQRGHRVNGWFFLPAPRSNAQQDLREQAIAEALGCHGTYAHDIAKGGTPLDDDQHEQLHAHLGLPPPTC